MASMDGAEEADRFARHRLRPQSDAAGAMNDVTTIVNSRRERLKKATLELHHRVEEVVEARAYFADRSSYGRWVLASLRFHRAAFADVCAATVSSCLGPRAIAERLELLELDLADMGIAVPPDDGLVAASRRDAAETLGVLYVTEGASLGARLLYNRVRRLGPDAVSGARFLGRQAHDLPSWRRFVQTLDGFEGSADQDNRLVQASCRTFDLAALHYGGPP